MPNGVLIDGGEVLLHSTIDGGETALTRNIDGGEIGESFQPLPHISIGEVTTLPAGSEATATMTGTLSQPLLNLGLVKGDKGDKGDAGTFESVSATVDANVGTPSVSVDYSGGNATFNFHSLKGVQGEQGEQGLRGFRGETGLPAGFGTVTATVDNNVGTPSVEVTTSGADTAKNIAFAFHNLKGEGSVRSVNNQTGDVVLDAEDVGALPDDTDIPTKISDLTNDQIYDLGALNVDDFGMFVFTEEQQTAIAQMWNKGLCALTWTENGQTYLSIKQGVITADGGDFYVFTGTWASVNSNVGVSTGMTTVFLPSIYQGYGIRLAQTLPNKTSDLYNDSGFLTLSTLPVWDGSVT